MKRVYLFGIPQYEQDGIKIQIPRRKSIYWRLRNHSSDGMASWSVSQAAGAMMRTAGC